MCAVCLSSTRSRCCTARAIGSFPFRATAASGPKPVSATAPGRRPNVRVSGRKARRRSTTFADPGRPTFLRRVPLWILSGALGGVFAVVFDESGTAVELDRINQGHDPAFIDVLTDKEHPGNAHARRFFVAALTRSQQFCELLH